MPRETSPWINGDHWLDKRRDGRSGDVWQIAWYDPATRCVLYRSTRQRDLGDAKAVLDAFATKERAARPQKVTDARVIPLLYLFWTEHGKHVRSPKVVSYSLRQFIGFLIMESPDIVVADLTPNLFDRFRRWRMGPHETTVQWGEIQISNASPGVKGETIQRNIEDVRAALNHHVRAGRIAYVPPIPSVKQEHRSQPRDLVLTAAQMGAIIGFTRSAPEDYRWIALMIATGMRPDAACAMDPAEQWNRSAGLIDLHPKSWPRTKKVNPIVPVIPELVPILENWPSGTGVKSKRRAWRTMRAAIGLPSAAVPKTIRHTVATQLRSRSVPAEQIESLLGHRVFRGTSAVYAKYDPNYIADAKRVLSILWREWHEQADAWDAVHLRDTGPNGKAVAIIKKVV